MNLDRYEDAMSQHDVAASLKTDDTDLSDEALDRAPGRGAACFASSSYGVCGKDPALRP
jgi:hypothetical protein